MKPTLPNASPPEQFRYSPSSDSAGIVQRLVLPQGNPSPDRIAELSTPTAPGTGTLTHHLIDEVLNGLATVELEALRELLDVPIDHLLSLLGISKATYHRRKNRGRLDASESDHVVRFARLAGCAVSTLETLDNARQWLSSPQTGLGGAVPLDYARTEVGAREVEDLLARIDYGVYS